MLLYSDLHNFVSHQVMTVLVCCLLQMMLFNFLLFRICSRFSYHCILFPPSAVSRCFGTAWKGTGDLWWCWQWNARSISLPPYLLQWSSSSGAEWPRFTWKCWECSSRGHFFDSWGDDHRVHSPVSVHQKAGKTRYVVMRTCIDIVPWTGSNMRGSY